MYSGQLLGQTWIKVNNGRNVGGGMPPPQSYIQFHGDFADTVNAGHAIPGTGVDIFLEGPGSLFPGSTVPTVLPPIETFTKTQTALGMAIQGPGMGDRATWVPRVIGISSNCTPPATPTPTPTPSAAAMQTVIVPPVVAPSDPMPTDAVAPDAPAADAPPADAPPPTDQNPSSPDAPPGE